MYRTKRDVDKHVETLMYKLSMKEFKTRSYSVARLYFDVGDFASCVKYVEQYLTSKDNNAAAHKLLGQAFQKLGQKEKALEQYKISLDIDPTQTTTILDICELLADDEIAIDPGRSRYWCEKAEAIFPRHPVTFQLRERLLNSNNPEPEALAKLLKAELAARPKDAVLHGRLLKHYMQTNNLKEAFEHSCNVEFGSKIFSQSFPWYEIVAQVLNNYHDTKDWMFQLLLLTVRERICLLSLTEIPIGSSKSLIESNNLLFAYDQAIESVAQVGACLGYAEFHSSLLKHHRGQLALHAATFLLKRAKKDQITWRDALRLTDPLMLIAWQTVPVNTKENWLAHAPEKQKNAVYRWYCEGSYRCSQSGHYLLSNCQDKSQLFLDQISQYCLSPEWKTNLHEKLYGNQDHQDKIKTSKMASSMFHVPTLRLPRRSEVEAYDCTAQKEYPNSLHHVVWILMNYKNYAHFNCTLFEMLMPTVTNCGPESLSKIDVHAFAYCAALTAKRQRHNQKSHVAVDKPNLLPANITDLLCSLTQTKWWDCAYKFSQNELGPELTDVRATLSAGIEVVRCMDNHGLDPEILCALGRIFNEQAKLAANTSESESSKLEMRAFLYYSAAIPLLLKLKQKTVIKIPERRLFDYTHTELSPKELNLLIEESKIFVALLHLRDGEYEKVIDLLSNIRTAQAFYYLGETYKRIAFEDLPSTQDAGVDSKYISLLNKAKHFTYKALEKLRELEGFKNNPLYLQSQELIEDIDACINKVDPELSYAVGYTDGKHSSDENLSVLGTDPFPMRTVHHIRNISSTPKHQSQANVTSYRTAMDSQLIENSRMDHQYLERIEKQMKNLQKRETIINDFMEQTKDWFKENSKLGNQIIKTIHSNTENTTEQFKLLKISVDQVKGQIDECRNECKDVVELKKQVADLTKAVNKLKTKASSDSLVDENNSYNLDENLRSNESSSTFNHNLPFSQPPVVTPFAQRLVPPFPVPPNPYQLYGQNLYNLYNQFSQFAQPQSVPSAPIFDPSRGPINYPNIFPTPDQMFLDVAHLLPPNMSAASAIPIVPAIPVVPSTPIVTASTKTPVTTSTTILKPSQPLEIKEEPKSLPMNVVITSSEPLTTSSNTAAPILSVTIPPQHIKGSPHNYQIQMPSTNVNKTASTPKFTNTQAENEQITTSSNIWNQSIFTSSTSSSIFNNFLKLDNSQKVNISGLESSPNITMNKSRTLSEKSNTSVENYDPCPDFKPIIPLPAEVKVTTGEEDEMVIFNARAKLFRFIDKQWKERGIGEMKLLQHKVTSKVRVLMRREQIHKVCANHIISPEMEIKPMKNETKAYFWVANDFAEETVILEKFCIRFKTAEIAKQFYDEFEKARSAALLNQSSDLIEKPKVSVKSFESLSQADNAIAKDQNKTVVGGFTFTSTPSFKSIDETKSVVTSSTPDATKSKVNVFSGLSFKTNSPTPFNNLPNFKPNENSSVLESNSENVNKLNSSDVVEEFEPAVDFKPVVPLPALVDQKTGEEDEIILFEHRAKLLRYDSALREWKERGLGNIKLLMHKENPQKIRLLMRREQIMKVCCNHSLSKEMSFQKMPNMEKAVTWCAKDFSDGELIPETFCLRFKTVQICDEFVEAVKKAQDTIKDDTKAAKEEKNAAKQINQIHSSEDSNIKTETSSGWGDKFKPKPGCWECKKCYIRNEASARVCCACESPKEELNPTKIDFKPNLGSETTTFNFVMPAKSKTVSSNWGDKFKPKEGTWECIQCLIRNESNASQCSACNNPRDPKSTTNATAAVDPSGPKFTFGINPTINEPNSESKGNLFFQSPGTKTFNFGIPVAKTNSVISFGDQKSVASSKSTDDDKNKEQPINFSIKNHENAMLPSNQTSIFFPTSTSNTTKKFGFTFNASQNNNEQDKNQQNESNVNLPSQFGTQKDKVESSITNENNQQLIFGQRSKLYKLISGKWEKQGPGMVKVLKNRDDKYRITYVQEQDQDQNAYLNYPVTSEMKHRLENANALYITVNDYSEGESRSESFYFKFAISEHASQLKRAIDEALSAKPSHDSKDVESDDVVFVSEILASNEEQRKAIELKLPENFYNYKNRPPCQGCRGCNDDDEAVANTNTKSTLMQSETDVSTPVKTSIQNIKSPSSSIYGTPGNFNVTADCSSFCTPLGSQGFNTKSLFASNNKPDSKSIDKENTMTQSSNIFGDNSGQKLNFGTANNHLNIFGTQSSTLIKKSVLAAPKLDSLSTSNETKTPGNDNVAFGSTGVSVNKSLFDFTVNKKGDLSQSSEVKSVFGGDQKPINLFSGASQGSIFGPTALKDDTAKISGLNFGTEDNGQVKNSSIFGKFSEPVPETKVGSFQVDSAIKPVTKDLATKGAENANVVEVPLKLDNALSFTALSSSQAGFNIQKSANFKWEGAGQQLFTSKSDKSMNDKSKDASATEDAEGDGGAEEEYDPHFEPIVPLPDKIVVTTGEEDEEKLYGERCKLFRYIEKTREWKERGVGEIKILYHPVKMTYRLLLRRELVHKAVLNMLLFMDLELLPMKNSDRAWTWAGINYAENAAGEQETLAVRFKTQNLAVNFHDKVVECVRKLQAAAAEAVRKEKEIGEVRLETVAPLRLPKHLKDSARVDEEIAANVSGQQATFGETGTEVNESKESGHAESKHVNFEETVAGDTDENDEHEQQYESEYNYDEEEEEEDDSGVHYSCKGNVEIEYNSKKEKYDDALIQVVFDQDIYSPKIIITDPNTGEVYADMLMYTNTEFYLNDETCSWSGIDYDACNKNVTINFPDSETALYFYDSCETSKSSAYACTDLES